ncbi:unnamed protein product [Porites lobata]|uniref:Uncharacterized protein n=2 Tax=Porites lobata TaxID=104759 RepID=A0ABN8NVX1_9CNID|nr:unnamed protein product [Porites lobata]CAH3142659.1 unnamed protein product [Porites lobata]
MHSDKLKLNSDKTECLLIGTRQQLQKVSNISTLSQSKYSLRSNESIFLELPCIKTHPTLGDRAFQSAAPYLWNALPSEIRNMKTLDTFKTAVKTHFFNLAFK